MAEITLDTFVTEYLFRVDKEQLKQLKGRLRGIQDGLRSTSKGFLAVGGAAAAAFGVAAKAAIDWEASFTGVRKTVTATEEELAVLEARLRRMARQGVPLDHAELASIAEAAGQLGIKTENVEGFTEVMAKLGVTTNLTSEAAATQAARFANIVRMLQDKYSNFGSTIVDLGNNMATTEAEILSMGLRLAGAGDLVGLTEDQILAFSASLSSLGIEAEAGGSAFSRIWSDMQAAVHRGSEELTTFAKVAGVSREAFQHAFAQSASKATIMFLQGLESMKKGGGDVHEALEDLGFDTLRVRDALLRMSGASDLVIGSLARAKRAWREDTALTKEAELRFGTLQSKIQFLKNNLYDLRIEIGSQLTPTLGPMIDKFKEWLNEARLWANENPRFVTGLAAVSAGLIAFGVALFAASVGVGLLRGAVGAWAWLANAKAFVAVKAALLSLSGVLAAIPIGWVVLAFVAAGLLIVKYWEPIKAMFFGFWKGFIKGVKPVFPIFTRLIDFMRALFKPTLRSKEELEAFGEVGQGMGYTIGRAIAWIIHSLEWLFTNWHKASQLIGGSLLGKIMLGLIFATNPFLGIIFAIPILWGKWEEISEWLTTSWLGLLLLGTITFINPFAGITLALIAFYENWEKINEKIRGTWIGRMLEKGHNTFLFGTTDEDEQALGRENMKAKIKAWFHGLFQTDLPSARPSVDLESMLSSIPSIMQGAYAGGTFHSTDLESMLSSIPSIMQGAYAGGTFHSTSLTAPPAGGRAGAGPGGCGQKIEKHTEVNIEQVNLNVTGKDGKQIADEFASHLGEAARDLAENADDDTAA